MNCYSEKNFSWKKDKLYFGKKNTGISIVPHATYPEMFHIKWEDGELSDFYNITWAKHNAVKSELRRINKPVEVAA
jgi:hypothetical protein